MTQCTGAQPPAARTRENCVPRQHPSAAASESLPELRIFSSSWVTSTGQAMRDQNGRFLTDPIIGLHFPRVCVFMPHGFPRCEHPSPFPFEF